MLNILLVEDNPIDARLMHRMLAEMTDWPTDVTWVDDGQKALWYLQSLDTGGVKDFPALVLLDLNLPKFDGLQVLEAFRNSRNGRKVPIFLLSSSPAECIEAAAESRQLCADAYLEKPYGLAGFQAMARSIRGGCMAILEARTAAERRQTTPALQ